jgi:hypothetical protein
MEDDNDALILAGSKGKELVKLVLELLTSDLTLEPTPEQGNKENLNLLSIKSIVSIYKNLKDSKVLIEYRQLDAYQEESYLLDAHWESVVSPAVTALRTFARQFQKDTGLVYSQGRIERLSSMIYQCIKCRGYKTIGTFFPIPLVFLLSNRISSQCDSFRTKYQTLLWLLHLPSMTKAQSRYLHCGVFDIFRFYGLACYA